MRVLHLSTHDIQGGAAKAAFRLHESLLAESIESMYLVQNKTIPDATVLGPRSRTDKLIGKIRGSLYSNYSRKGFSPANISGWGIRKQIEFLNPDVIHLHWVNENMLSLKDISKFRKPILWSMHDLWPVTGGCHYNGSCRKFESHCGACPLLGSTKTKDISFRQFALKRKVYSNADITFNGLSKWIAREAQASSISGVSVVNLPNTINCKVYAPIEKSVAKSILKLEGRRTILFGAVDSTSDPRKGYSELLKSLKILSHSSDLHLMIFGHSKIDQETKDRFQITELGFLHDDLSLKLVYSCADVVVVPSIQENLSNTILESMACGTPVVGFDIGGNQDMIEHLVNGYLAKPFNSEDLANGIQYVLENPQMSVKAREKVQRDFDYGNVAKRYLETYNGLAK